jgi:hypothetical protein
VTANYPESSSGSYESIAIAIHFFRLSVKFNLRLTRMLNSNGLSVQAIAKGPIYARGYYNTIDCKMSRT